MDLIHCQRCGVLPGVVPDHQRQRYYMTSCAHLFCEPCVRNFTNRCPTCQSNCSLTELNGQSNPDVKSMFNDPVQVLKEAISKPMRILSFQKQINKDKVKIMGKLVSTLNSARTEVTSLKGELARLRQRNEELTQNNTQLQMRNHELEMAQMAGKVSPINQVYALNVPGHGGGGESANLFQDPMERQRPNAQVQPIVQPIPQHSTTAFSIARTPQSVVSVDSSNGQFFSHSRAPGGGGYSRAHVNLSPQSVAGSGSRSGTSLFTTPTSSPHSYLQSPFFKQHGNSAGMFGAGNVTPVSKSGSTPNKTPDLINRLRNMRCKPTGGAPPSPRF